MITDYFEDVPVSAGGDRGGENGSDTEKFGQMRNVGLRFRGIKTKIGLALLCVVTGFLTLFGMYEYIDAKAAFTKELRDLGEITVERLAENLRLPLWEVDNAWANKIVDTEMRNKKVHAIFVEGEGGLFVGKARNDEWEPVKAADDMNADCFFLEKAVLRNDQEIGRVKVYITKKFMAEQLRKVALNLLLTVVLLGFCILAFLSLMLHRIIIRPIHKILWLADSISAGDYGGDMEISQKDEIGLLGRRFNTMRQKIRLRESQRDKAERKLQRYQEHLEDLVRDRTEDLGTAQRIANLGNWVWEKHENRVTWSDEIYRILGFEPRQIEASCLGLLRRVHPEDRESVVDAFKTSRKNGEPYGIECRVLRADGSERIVFAQGEDVSNETKSQTRTVGTVQDITERVQTEKALRDSERRLAEIIDFLPEATFVVDTEGRIIAWNRALEKMTGLKSEDMLGKGDYAYAIPFYGERRPVLIDLAVGRGEIADQHYLNLQEDEGTLIANESFCPNLRPGGAYVSATARLLCDSGGNRAGAIESVRDITWRKRLERELVEAKEAAEAANQAKSAFLATMSHELRTPMNAVIGMTYLCMGTETTSKQQQYLNTIYSSSQGLLRILNDILDLSKIEAGKLEMDSVGFRLDEVWKSVFDVLGMKARGKGLKLLLEEAPDVPRTLVGDPLRLGQILVNLVGNAVKFTDSGEVVVSVVLVREDRNRAMLRFSVRDTGIGLAKEKISNLFEAFSQLDSSSNPRFGGVGLGLSICRRLVEMMGGQIDVESRLDEGSTFTFTALFGLSGKRKGKVPSPSLEQEGARVLAINDQKDSGTLDAHGEYRLKRNAVHGIDVARALVIEDNETNQAVAVDLLKNIGVEVTVAGDGQKGIDKLEKGEFDFVLMDIEMPVMNGYEATRRIRRSPRHGRIPIIAVTAHAMSGIRERAIQAGMNDCVTKPIDPPRLYTVLSKLFASDRFVKARAMPIAEDFDPERLVALLTELKKLLEDSDGRAVKSAGFIVQYAKGSSICGQLEKMERFVKAYDYDGALKVLSKLELGLKNND